MAIYHLNVRGVALSRGSSPVRSSAYQTALRMTSERTGERCKYKKRSDRVVLTRLSLPDDAPSELWDRETLWNAMEAAARGTELAAKRVEFALPKELSRVEQEAACREVADYFRSRGCAVDWAIHDSGDGNPHCHMLVTALPLSMMYDPAHPELAFRRPDTPRTEKHYLCRRTGEPERWVPSSEWRTLRHEGWEKVYRYPSGDKEIRLTKGEAEKMGLSLDDRVNKHPVSKNVVRGGEVLDRDAAKEELVALRELWANVANKYLAEYAKRTGTEPVTIDHRSNKDRGIELAPTQHEGPAVRAAEARAEREAVERGVEYAPVTDRRRENVETGRLNAALRAISEQIAEMEAVIRELGRRLLSARETMRANVTGSERTQIDLGDGAGAPVGLSAVEAQMRRSAEGYNASHGPELPNMEREEI